MNVTPEVLDWIRKAEDDLAAARRLAEGGRPLPDQMGFFCQQATEKYINNNWWTSRPKEPEAEMPNP